MRKFFVILIAALGIALIDAGCTTAPPTTSDRQSLHDDVASTLNQFYSDDPGMQSYLNTSYGYVLFPSVGKGGVIVGGSYGRGEVFERGAMVGYADITQATIGAQAGGQTFSELIAFENADALQRFESGQFAFAANASAVAIKSGAAVSAKYDNGVTVFVHSEGGLMVEAAVGGQSFSFTRVMNPGY